jgi:hypothetical protein
MNSLSVQRTLAIFVFITFSGSYAPAQRTPQKPTLQSLAGDWEYGVGVAKLTLHLSVDASGAATGAIDTPDSPPKHLELSDIQLSGNILTYTAPSIGKMTEVILPDGKTMAGPVVWQRVNNAPISPQDAAGDWRSTDPEPIATTLRLRLDASGSLTGTIELPLPNPHREKLGDIQIDGRKITFKTPEGGMLGGTFSNDRESIVGNTTWEHKKTLEQAVAADAQVKILPTDGTWSGTITHIPWSDKSRHDFETLQFIFRFNSAPVSCSVDSPLHNSNGVLPCNMKLDGGKVNVTTIMGVFNGTLNGTQITGSWMFNSQIYSLAGAPIFQGPMELNLTRTAPAPN